jgi:phage-related protein
MSLKINPAIIKINHQLSNHSDLASERLAKLKRKNINKRIDESIKKQGGVLQAQEVTQEAIKKTEIGGKGKKDSHKTSAKLILKGKSLKEVAQERDIKEQTVISHLARYIKESEDPKKELLNFKKLKPPAKQIKDLKAILAKNRDLDLGSRYILKDLQKKCSEAGLNLTYEQLALTLIWV